MLNTAFSRNVMTAASILALAGLILTVPAAMADETCQSPYMAKITGEEEFVYVWTLGIEGIGDGSDKLVTVDVRKDSPDLRQGDRCRTRWAVATRPIMAD